MLWLTWFKFVLSEKFGPVFRGKNYAIVLSPNIFELAPLLQYLAYYFGNAVIRSILHIISQFKHFNQSIIWSFIILYSSENNIDCKLLITKIKYQKNRKKKSHIILKLTSYIYYQLLFIKCCVKKYPVSHSGVRTWMEVFHINLWKDRQLHRKSDQYHPCVYFLLDTFKVQWWLILFILNTCKQVLWQAVNTQTAFHQCLLC